MAIFRKLKLWTQVPKIDHNSAYGHSFLLKLHHCIIHRKCYPSIQKNSTLMKNPEWSLFIYSRSHMGLLHQPGQKRSRLLSPQRQSQTRLNHSQWHWLCHYVLRVKCMWHFWPLGYYSGQISGCIILKQC